MTHSVRIAPAAADDIARLIEFLVDKSPTSAMRAAEAVERAVASLSELPQRGRAAGPSGLRELVVGFGRSAYILQYRVDEGAVIIARIFHSLEDRER